jgi:hypothetical protein
MEEGATIGNPGGRWHTASASGPIGH